MRFKHYHDILLWRLAPHLHLAPAAYTSLRYGGPLNKKQNQQTKETNLQNYFNTTQALCSLITNSTQIVLTYNKLQTKLNCQNFALGTKKYHFKHKCSTCLALWLCHQYKGVLEVSNVCFMLKTFSDLNNHNKILMKHFKRAQLSPFIT